MKSLSSLSVAQLRKAVAIKEQIEQLEATLASITGDTTTPQVTHRKRRMSAAGRVKIAAPQKARWAKVKGRKAKAKPAKKKDRRSSPAVRAKLAMAAKLRWAKVKAAGMKAL
jgi:hypothetical protein